MQYLHNNKLIRDNGETFTLGGEEATAVDLLKVYMMSYRPTQGQVLDLMGNRRWNKVLDILEAGSGDLDYIEFEDEDWKVLVQIFRWVAPNVSDYALMRNLPAIEKLCITAVTETKPLVLQASKAPNGAKAN